MGSGRILWFATLVIAAIIGPAPARAGLGLEVMLRPGYGSAGDKSPVLYQPTGDKRMQASSIWAGTANPYGGGFVLDGAVGYRPLSFISVGLTGGWRTSSVSSSAAPDVSGANRSGLQIGVYGRGYLPLVGRLTDLDPWVSVGATYVYDKQTYTQPTAAAPGIGTVSLTHQGVGIPLAIGIEYRILPFLAVGPSFQYEIVTGVGACMIPSASISTDGHQCSDADSSIRVTATKNYQIWSIGLGLRLAL